MALVVVENARGGVVTASPRVRFAVPAPLALAGMAPIPAGLALVLARSLGGGTVVVAGVLALVVVSVITGFAAAWSMLDRSEL